MEELNQVTQQVDQYTELAIQFITQYGGKVVLAILTLIIGLWIIGKIGRAAEKAMVAAKVEKSLAIFLEKLGTIILKVLLLISVAGMVGIETTSFIAVFGAAGLAVGLALQGSLSNFAGGVMILLFKPFKVGDFVEAQGYAGVVQEIQIFNTIIHTGDKKTIIIPNGNLSNGNIVNYSTSPLRRVDMVFGIGYDDDLKKAKEVLCRLVDEDDRVLKDPEKLVVVSALADSSVNFTVRAWVNSADYWGVFFDMHEKVKLTFDAEGISIPYPQQDVHLYKNEG
ncbi:mechanosensitive ion channel family protein [Motiliproteus sediminis]|uniref:mechanosensitive ion channel family protein n=1 Tax=Motiliproteus sediminis TaxID=1468178 RepID=UPI001AEF8256|nr:mechanosensitive ion channel domain-containing protein [Motiliproteus sediminis]